MSYSDKNERFKYMMTELVKVAEADGTVTAGEAEILKRVKLSILEFEQGVEKALDDGIITDTESLILQNIEQNILQVVFDMIEKDTKLGEDEKRLVEMVFDIVMNTLDN